MSMAEVGLELGVDHVRGHPDVIPEPIDNHVHVEGTVVVHKA